MFMYVFVSEIFSFIRIRIFRQIMSSDEGDQSHYTRIKQRVNRKIDHVKGDVLQVTFVKTLSVKDFKREILSFHSS
jgi:hypothetical protein